MEVLRTLSVGFEYWKGRLTGANKSDKQDDQSKFFDDKHQQVIDRLRRRSPVSKLSSDEEARILDQSG